MNNEITNQMKIKSLTAEQAELLISIIEYHTIYPYSDNRDYKKEKCKILWASNFIEFYYFVSTDTHTRKEIKFFDWVLNAKEQIAEISKTYCYENDELRQK